MNLRITCFFFAFLFLNLLGRTMADERQFEIRPLTNSNGLSNSSVNAIFQDSDHVLWIGTWDGLNRYDGHAIQIFRPEPDNPNSLSNQVILKIEEGKDGDLWILTMHGINRLNPYTKQIKRYFFGREEKAPLTESEFHLAVDQQRNVFFEAKDWGLGYYANDSVQRFPSGDLPSLAVKKISFSPLNTLLIQYANGDLADVSLQHGADGTITIVGYKKIGQNVRDFINESDDKLLILTNDGRLAFYQFSTGKTETTRFTGIQKLIGRTSLGVLLAGEKEHFILTPNGQIERNSWLGHINSRKLSTVFEGNEGVVWIGTDGDGIYKLFPRHKLFHSVTQTQIEALRGGNVRAFSLAPDSALWVGTKGQGLFRFSPHFYLNGPEENIPVDNFYSANSSLNNSVFSLFCGKDSLMFIGTDGEGLSVYDLRYHRVVDWQSIEGTANYAPFRSVYAIYQDAQGFIWLGTNGYGMFRLRMERDGRKLKLTNFKQYEANENLAGKLSSNIIFSIIPENDHELWIGTRLGGLNLFDKGSETFRVFRKEPADSLSLSSDDILCLYKDTLKRLWIGTSLGLNYLETNKLSDHPAFHSFTTNDGLPNNTIHGMVCDHAGNLWVSTNLGLSQFNVENHRFRNFTEEDGLQNNEFADGAFFRDNQTGYIFMGGNSGFNYFRSSDIGEYTYIPNIAVSAIKGQNDDQPYYPSFVVTPELRNPPHVKLKYDQNFFDITLAALSFINSEKCQYAYYLENFDKQWNNIQTRRVISFTNVPPGKYTLWLKWSNSDGIWSPPVHAIDFQIKPIFWESAWAIGIYVLLTLFFLLFVQNYWKKQQLLKQNIELRKREEALHQNKLTFFTNIAHELQTPLTLIVGPSQKLADDPGIDQERQKFVRMIQRNTNRLLFLIQQLMEFRKAEYGHLEMEKMYFNLVNLVEQIAELFDDWAIQNQIDYTIDSPSEIPGWFDQDKIEKIIFNLLSNAFKYTPKGGNIKLKMQVDEAKSQVRIEVMNSGKGIPKEKIPRLFERFFITDEGSNSEPDKFRTGIGLAYARSLVTALGGTIDVESVENELTTFAVVLPCSQENAEAVDAQEPVDEVILSRQLQHILVEPKLSAEENGQEKIRTLEALENKLKTVLIVEDEPDIHLLLDGILKDKYRLLTAFNGVEALKVLETEMPDLIISDVMMPEMDGIALCKQLKTELKTCHIPIILLTAKSSVTHRIEGLESGANSYIPKPFHRQHLEIRIEKLLEERERIARYFQQDNGMENLTQLSIAEEDQQFIDKVMELIRQHISDEELQAVFLEKEMGMSSSQFYRKLKQISGMSPGDMIRSMRLKHAAHLLKTTSMTVTEVFYQSGFNNRSYFYREFQKMYQIPPKQFQLSFKK
ncbi:hybrid sensor histidine kinase/response regulator transcription factor [Prolixibacter bellariivorans]|nr:two-component regulator propeller domain-containing protein [Prolixibacter bellariivorans]